MESRQGCVKEKKGGAPTENRDDYTRCNWTVIFMTAMMMTSSL